MKLILTCEHGGNVIPVQYHHYFKNYYNVLETHRGYDLGALDLFQHVAPLADYSLSTTTSRLLIELNRSLHHRDLFSIVSKSFTAKEKESIISTYYEPYRELIKDYITKQLTYGEKIIHLSIHTFTPQLDGMVRHCDIGLLYDSKVIREKRLCDTIINHLKMDSDCLKIRRNYPYLGKADGLTTTLRTQFSEDYMGIEIEVNQKFSTDNKMDASIKELLFKVIKQIKSKPDF